jgi:hypothetical protein
MGHYGFISQARPGGGAAGRITNHGGVITDNQHHLVPQILKLLQFSYSDGMAKMNIRGGRVKTLFDSERPVILNGFSQSIPEFLLGENIDRAPGNNLKLSIQLTFHRKLRLYQLSAFTGRHLPFPSG